MKKQKVNIVTLGCSKNLVDSEYLMKQLEANGFEVYHDDDEVEADCILLNTCGFIHDAKEESVDYIFNAVNVKEAGDTSKVIVFGCLSQRYKEALKSDIPEVDRFFGVDEIPEIVEFLGGKYKSELDNERFTTTPKHYAFLKVGEGCNWGCSYCAIPLIRGKHISKPIEDLVFEAKMLAKKGVKELILIAQDLTYYGIDLYGERKLAELLVKLEAINGIEWIRLHYAYPTKFPMEVIELMKNSSKICSYLDIPLQHINTKVLKNMRRGISKEQTIELMNYMRTEIPNMAIRTTMLVGHPGEGEEEFNELLEFVKEFKFDRLGVFPYSLEEDTYSADNFEDTVSEEVKQSRVDEIMEIQMAISMELNKQKVGKTFKTLIDRREGEYYVGRTEFDSPEVDNEVLIESDKELEIGEFYSVKVYKAESYDLYGEII